jgi:hypothetical protein
MASSDTLTASHGTPATKSSPQAVNERKPFPRLWEPERAPNRPRTNYSRDILTAWFGRLGSDVWEKAAAEGHLELLSRPEVFLGAMVDLKKEAIGEAVFQLV